MSPWDFLGIQPTQDRLAIKRAYVTMLKRHNPQTDPEGFKQLRAAYEAATYHAEWSSRWGNENQSQSEDGQPENSADAAEAGPSPEAVAFGSRKEEIPADAAAQPAGQSDAAPDSGENLSEDEEQADETAAEAAVERLLGELKQILLTAERRNRLAEWNRALQDPALDVMEIRLRVGFGFVGFVCGAVEADPSLQLPLVWTPAEIWRRLDAVFGWSQMELEMARYFPADELQFFMAQIHEAHGRSSGIVMPLQKPLPVRTPLERTIFSVVGFLFPFLIILVLAALGRLLE